MEAVIHVAGTSCVDYSARGQQAGLEGGTLPAFLAWMLLRAAIQETYILHENVSGFCVNTLAKPLERWYDVESQILDAYAFGWPVSRKRRYTLLRHKLKSLPFRSPLTIFTKMFCRNLATDHDDELENGCEPAWSCFMVATLDELQDEIKWASERPMSSAMLDLDSERPHLSPLSGYSYHVCLTECEQGFLDKYEKQFPNCAYSLNQNPDFGATHSSHRQLHCLIKNLGLLWMLAIDCV